MHFRWSGVNFWARNGLSELNFTVFQTRTQNWKEQVMLEERDDEMNEVVMDNGEYSSPEEEIEALRQKLEEREEQLSKAVGKLVTMGC